MSNEVWKTITGYENYKVSNKGNIYSNHKNRLKVLQTDKDGYKKVTIFNKEKTKCIAVHRLVAKEFLENKENKPYVNHIDGVKHNNDVGNLEWCTQSENELHAHETGLKNIRKIVICNELKRQFNSTIEATKWLRKNGKPKASRSSISEACNGVRKSAYGYTWRYKDGEEQA